MENFNKEDILKVNSLLNKTGLSKLKQRTLKEKDSTKAFYLGIAYLYGINAEKNVVTASRWFESCAEWGNHEGFYGAGLCGAIEKDFDYAEKMLLLGLSHGCYRCAIGLGNIYELKPDIGYWNQLKKKNIHKALEYYETALKNDIYDVLIYLIPLMMDKLKKSEKAYAYLDLALEKIPHDKNIKYFQACRLESVNLQEALNIHADLANEGLRESQHIIAMAMYDGLWEGTPDHVMSMLRRASMQNYAPSQSVLSMLYDAAYSYPLEQKDSPELLEKAFVWIRRAIKNGNQNHQYALTLKRKFKKLGMDEPEDKDDEFFAKSSDVFNTFSDNIYVGKSDMKTQTMAKKLAD